MTMIHDANNLPFLYIAHKTAGLSIYDISDPSAPLFVSNVPITLLDSLDVMSLTQEGNFVYLALGNSFTNPQRSGMAIVDVSNQALPVVTDFYVVPNSASGGGIVKVENNLAYFGAMQSGLVILDVTDKYDIQFVSQFIPDISFPPVTNPNPNLYNARGMEVKDGIVYLCYDAGGIRIINCSDPSQPVETGRWCNPAMYQPFNMPKAYNNCVLDDTLLYVAVDYAGMEVLNIADTSSITMTGWWNPYNAPANNWFTSPVHANEIHFEKNCSRVFMSTGHSDMYVVDVSDPSAPDSCNYYGGVNNGIGTWGIGMWENQIYLSYICTLIPFSSNWTGVKILTYNSCLTNIEATTTPLVTVHPNPVNNTLYIHAESPLEIEDLQIYNMIGEAVDVMISKAGNSFSLDCNMMPDGLYFLRLNAGTNLESTTKIMVANK